MVGQNSDSKRIFRRILAVAGWEELWLTFSRRLSLKRKIKRSKDQKIAAFGSSYRTLAQSSPSFFNRYRIDRNDNFNRCAAAVRFQRVSSNAWRMSLRSTSSR